MRLCLDEHYSGRIATDLRALGHDVHCVKERSELVSLSDEELLAVMTSERRALLTENVADFAPIIQRLVTAGESHYGIIYTSHRTMPRARNTIGVYVKALDVLLRRYPGEADFVNGTEWLAPPG
jgi:hypothetical protein